MLQYTTVPPTAGTKGGGQLQGAPSTTLASLLLQPAGATSGATGIAAVKGAFALSVRSCGEDWTKRRIFISRIEQRLLAAGLNVPGLPAFDESAPHADDKAGQGKARQGEGRALEKVTGGRQRRRPTRTEQLDGRHLLAWLLSRKAITIRPVTRHQCSAPRDGWLLGVHISLLACIVSMACVLFPNQPRTRARDG